jgi:hypothetical protein
MTTPAIQLLDTKRKEEVAKLNGSEREIERLQRMLASAEVRATEHRAVIADIDEAVKALSYPGDQDHE